MECPEAIERGRNFRLLNQEELPQLLEFLTTYLPESLKFHQTVLTYIRNRVWEFYFYVADGWPEVPICLHFPGMTLSPHGLLYESVGVFCPAERLELLQLLRDEDILIDWSKPLYFNFVHCEIADELVRLYEDTGNAEKVLGDVWACDDPENTADDTSTDDCAEREPDVQVLPLQAEHAESIHELYPANTMECHEVFLRLIKTLSAAGVFVDGSLAAWMVQSYYGAMFSMQTKPEYRRKGYGTKLARYLTKRIAEEGYTPFVVIRPENEASQSLYKKLGFRKLYQTVRATLTPFSWQEPEEENSTILLGDKLGNAVKRLQAERRVIDAFEQETPNEEESNGLEDDEETIRRQLETIEVKEAEAEEELEGTDVEEVDDSNAIVQEPDDERSKVEDDSGVETVIQEAEEEKETVVVENVAEEVDEEEDDDESLNKNGEILEPIEEQSIEDDRIDSEDPASPQEN